MDPLTHTLTGIAMARAGLARRHGPGTTLLLALAANAPDVDVAARLFFGEQSPTYRRTFTHGVVGAPLLALALALLFWLPRRGRGLPALFALALLGVASHVALDLLNSYGVVVLHPFSSVRFELGWVFIVDLAVWAILLAPLVLRRPLRPHAEALSRASLAAFALYVALCGAAHARTRALLRLQAAREQVVPDLLRVFPEPLGPQRFRGVVREGDTYRSWLFHVPSGRAESLARVHTDAHDPRVEAVRRRPWPRRLEWFFAAPVWRLDPDGRVAEVTDLRFRSAVLGGRADPFSHRFPVAAAPPDRPEPTAPIEPGPR